MDRIQPSRECQYSELPENKSALQTITSNNNTTTSSTNTSDGNEVPPESVNFQEVIIFEDEVLKNLTIKNLNQKLKSLGIKRNTVKDRQIRDRRRTLLNCGYAASYRHKEEEKIKSLEKGNLKLIKENAKYERILFNKYKVNSIQEAENYVKHLLHENYCIKKLLERSKD